jgi:hypothetical protein
MTFFITFQLRENAWTDIKVEKFIVKHKFIVLTTVILKIRRCDDMQFDC